MTLLPDPAPRGQSPQRAEAPLVDLQLLLQADRSGAGLHGEKVLLTRASHAHLDAFRGQRDVPLLDLIARMGPRSAGSRSIRNFRSISVPGVMNTVDGTPSERPKRFQGEPAVNHQETVAVLGAGGTMGFAMARNLARGGFAVRAWNRSRERAEPLAEEGARVLDTAAQAAPPHRGSSRGAPRPPPRRATGPRDPRPGLRRMR